MNLYEIANQYESMFNDAFDLETGEINDIAIEKFNAVAEDFNKKGVALASYIMNMDAERLAIANAKKSMAERESRLDKKVEYLASYLKSNMQRLNIEKITCPYFSIALKKCPISVDITNEAILPQEFRKIKTEISIDKMKIKEKLSEGVEIPGASLKQNVRLEIK